MRDASNESCAGYVFSSTKQLVVSVLMQHCHSYRFIIVSGL